MKTRSAALSVLLPTITMLFAACGGDGGDNKKTFDAQTALSISQFKLTGHWNAVSRCDETPVNADTLTMQITNDTIQFSGRSYTGCEIETEGQITNVSSTQFSIRNHKIVKSNHCNNPQAHDADVGYQFVTDNRMKLTNLKSGKCDIFERM